MTLAAILAVIDGGSASAAALRGALALGRTFGAHVEALHVRIDPNQSVPYMAEGMSAMMIEQVIEGLARTAEERAAEARRVFAAETDAAAVAVLDEAATPQAGRCSTVLRFVTGQEPEEVARRGRLFDVIVVARPAADDEGGFSPTLESALFETGRPVLMMPSKAGPELLEKVVIGWNASREAARAVAAALSLLVRARSVEVVTLRDGDRHADPAELVRYLALHGVRATSRVVERDEAGQAATLPETLIGGGASLLVMGAYGHSRLRELVLGGATRSAVTDSQTPVLLAH